MQGVFFPLLLHFSFFDISQEVCFPQLIKSYFSFVLRAFKDILSETVSAFITSF